MAQLEPWQKVWINADSSFSEIDPTHGRLGCITCHGGTEPVIAQSDSRTDLFYAMMEAHEAEIHYDSNDNPDLDEVFDHSLIHDPSVLELAEGSCGNANCHPQIVELNATSMHTQLWGEKHKVALRAGFNSFEDCPAILQDGYQGECTSCHTTCGQCHVSRPHSVHGGFLDSHRFQKTPDMENNCTACHGSRVGNDWTGHLAGNEPDVHQSLGFDCLTCHQEDLHGDGRTDYTSRYEVEGVPSCKDCHSNGADNNIFHETHWPAGEGGVGLACQVCHSQPYTSCINCHTNGVWSSEDNEGYAEFPTFRIGYNSGNWPTHPREEEEYVVVRHVPVSEDSYEPWGWPVLEDWADFETWQYSTPHNIQVITRQTEVAAQGPVDASNCWISCHAVEGFEDNKNLFLYRSYVDSLGESVSNPTQTERQANRNVTVNSRVPTYWLND